MARLVAVGTIEDADIDAPSLTMAAATTKSSDEKNEGEPVTLETDTAERHDQKAQKGNPGEKQQLAQARY